MLMFKSSPYGSFNHSHGDQNSFVVYGYGEPLLIDSGYYDWYNSPHDKEWTRQTKAHNCVIVNGEGQPIHDKSATGEILRHFTSPRFDYTCGDATTAYKGKLKRFERHILYLRPDAFLIYDELEAPEPGAFTWCLHAEEEMAVRAEENAVVVARGAAKCLVRFLTPEKLTFEQSDQFTTRSTRDLKDEWHVYATADAKAEKTAFAALVRPYRASEPDDALQVDSRCDSALAVRLADGAGRRDYLAVNRQGGAVQVFLDSGVVTDARFCAFSQGDGEFTIALVDGTEFTLADGPEGRVLFHASAPVTAAVAYRAQTGCVAVREITCQCAQQTELTVAMDGAVGGVVLDGQGLAEADFTVDAGRGTLGLTVPPGDHVLEVVPKAE